MIYTLAAHRVNPTTSRAAPRTRNAAHHTRPGKRRLLCAAGCEHPHGLRHSTSEHGLHALTGEGEQPLSWYREKSSVDGHCTTHTYTHTHTHTMWHQHSGGLLLWGGAVAALAVGASAIECKFRKFSKSTMTTEDVGCGSCDDTQRCVCPTPVSSVSRGHTRGARTH